MSTLSWSRVGQDSSLSDLEVDNALVSEQDMEPNNVGYLDSMLPPIAICLLVDNCCTLTLASSSRVTSSIL